METRLFKWGLVGFSALMLSAVILAGCGGHVEPAGGTTPPVTNPPAAVSSLSMAPDKITVFSDNSDTTTFTLFAISAASAPVSGATATLSASSGFLSTPQVNTDAQGRATFSFSSGVSDSSNRTATITATSGSVTATYLINIVGSTVEIDSTATSLTDSGSNTATVTITANNKAGTPVPDVPVTLAKTAGSGTVTIASSSGRTGADGRYSTTITGSGAGTATLTATALGATRTLDLTVQAVTARFGIIDVKLNGSSIPFSAGVVAMGLGQNLQISVAAPGITTVDFVSSQGVFGTSPFLRVPVSAGVASATLTSAQAGLADVVVSDSANPLTSEKLTVGMTSQTATTIAVQASPQIVPRSVGGSTGSSQIIATVRDALNQPVGNSPVVFSIKSGTQTGGGEHFSTPIAYSSATASPALALGQATTTFVSGSLASSGTGVTVVASIPNTALSAEVSINIGGQAGSIVFGHSTKIASIASDTAYEYPSSLLVADSSGNPVPNAAVTLNAWPIAFSIDKASVCAAANDSWYYNEDRNENTILNGDGNLATCAGQDEDGDRTAFNPATPSAARPPASCGAGASVNGQLTPANSAGGTVPQSVTTGANGLAEFKMTYPKSSAIWTTVRLRASTSVQGTETVAEEYFALPPLEDDTKPCRLSNPYNY